MNHGGAKQPAGCCFAPVQENRLMSELLNFGDCAALQKRELKFEDCGNAFGSRETGFGGKKILST